jgi:hypothetical protein
MTTGSSFMPSDHEGEEARRERVPVRIVLEDECHEGEPVPDEADDARDE